MPLSYAQIEGVWIKAAAGTKYATKPWAALMAAIAEAESGGNAGITNPDDNNGKQTSWGLWQISNGTHTAPAANWADPATNAQLAIQKLNTQGLGAWGTYTSGAYKAYINGGTTPDLTVAGNPSALTAELTAAQAGDCLYGFSGVAGTSWINDILGNGGNVGQICILTRSEARGVVGVLMLAGGAWIIVQGLGLAAAYAGLQTPLGHAAESALTKGAAGRSRAAPAPQGAPAAGP